MEDQTQVSEATTETSTSQASQPTQATQTTLTDQPTAKKLPVDEILFGVLSYFTISVLATVVTKPHSEFCKFHAKQGIALIILDILFLVFTTIALAIVPILAYLVFFLGIIGMFGLHLLGIVNSVQGKMYRIPFVYEVSKKIDLQKLIVLPKKGADMGERAVQNTLKQSESVRGEASENQNLVDTNVQGQNNNAPQAPTAPAQNNPFQETGQNMVERAVDKLNEEKGQTPPPQTPQS